MIDPSPSQGQGIGSSQVQQTPSGRSVGHFPQIAACLVIGIGIIVLLGWQYNVMLLEGFLPGFPRMNPMTAIALIAMSMSLILLRQNALHPDAKSARVAQAFAGLAALIALLKLASLVFGWTPSIDQWFYRKALDVGSTYPVRMAPSTVMDCLLLSASLMLFSKSSFAGKLSQSLALFAGSISLVAATGYAYGIAPVDRFAFFLQMSMPTAVAFLLLSCGILLLTPGSGLLAGCFGNSAGAVVSRRLLPAAVAIPIVFGWLRILGQRARWFDPEVGIAFTSAGYIIVLIGVVLWTVHVLQYADTERAEAEKALRESEERYHLLFESNPHPVFVFELDTLAILDVNAAAIRQYGHSYGTFLTLTLKDIRPPEDVPQLLKNIAALEGHAVQQGTYRHCRSDGSIMDVEVASYPLIYAGRQARIVVATDVTQRKRTEAALHNSQEDLRLRNVQLEALNKELEAFSYSVSHDLRAPLRGIDGFSQALFEDYGAVIDETGKNYLQRVRAAAQRMSTLIDDMLNLARVTRSEMHRESIDLSAIARSIAAELQQESPQRAVEFVMEQGLLAQGDARLLRVAFENLLRNAWKFTSKHDRARIAFGRRIANGREAYFVQDDGAGFDSQYAARLFCAFQRLHAEEEFSGTGIGLATVNRIIKRHGGELWAEGEVEKGATFYFTL